MTKKIINIGSSENAGNGDPLRIAFNKVNENFNELYAIISGGGELVEVIGDNVSELFSRGTQTGIIVAYNDNGSNEGSISLTVANQSWNQITDKPDLATVATTGSYNDLTDIPPSTSSGTTPPTSPVEGTLWYDATDGRLYVFYDGFWVEASPESVYVLPTASTTVLGGVKVDGSTITILDGVISAQDPDLLGDLVVTNTTIGTSTDNSPIILQTHNGATEYTWTLDNTGRTILPDGLELPVSSFTESLQTIEVIVADLLLDATVDYSTGEGDNIPQNTYGTHIQINHPWAVYRFTTTPTPALEIEDIIAGDAVPAVSTVLVVGTGGNSNIVVVDKTITGLVPANGAVISIARPTTNAALRIETDADTDIVLATGPRGRIGVNGSFAPLESNLYDLGTPTKRFKRLWLGGASIYIEDEVTGADLRITAINGDLVVAGGAGLEVGEFRFRDNQLFLTNPNREIIIGTTGATAPVTFKRTIQVRNSTDEYDLLNVDQQGRVTILSEIATDPTEAAMSIVGARDRIIQSPANLGVLLQLTGTSLAPTRLYSDSYGAVNYSAFIGRNARGNSTVPTQTLTNDIIARVGANPHDGVGFASISTMRMDFVNAEDQTTSARGSKMEFWTTAIGSTTIGKRVTIDGSDIVLTVSGGGGIKFADSTRQTTAWLGSLSYNSLTDLPDLSVYELIADAFSGSWDDLTDKPTAVSYWTNDAGYLTSASSLAWNKLTGVPSLINSISASTGITASTVAGVTTIGNSGVLSVVAASGAGQLTVGNVGQNITLTMPQALGTTSNVTFNDLTINGTLTVTDINIETAPTIAGKTLFLAADALVAADIDGGGIQLGPIASAFDRSFLYNLEFDRWDTDGAGLKTLEITADSIFVSGHGHFGNAFSDYEFPNASIQVDANEDTYIQVVAKNHSGGISASSDFVATNNIGDDTQNYIDMGIVSSNYSDVLWPILAANDGYVYINGGNLRIGTDTATKDIKFFTGGTLEENIRATISDTGLEVVGDVSATSFTGDVTGNVSGNAGTVTNGVYTNGSYANPSWITSLAYSKITDVPTIYSSAYVGTTSIAFNRASAAQSLTGVSIDGNAGTATKLAATKNINGVAFDGSLDIVVTAAGSTLTGTSLASNILSSSLTSVGTLTNLTVTNTISGSVTGNAGTVTNGVYTNGSYANPTWITSLAWSKISGAPSIPTSVYLGTTQVDFNRASGTLSLSDVNITGNAGTVTNGVYTNGSYSNPTWITSLAWSKISGAPTSLSAFTNEPGYLTGITGSQVTTALGYTPYNATNPAGYTTNTGTVTSIATSGSVSGLTLTGGTITTSGTITLGGSLSLTSLQITNGLGYTPYNATNPAGYTTNTGTVTSVAALTLGTTGTDITSTVANSTTTPVITLNVPTASALNRGALSAADWTTFNSKGNGTVTSVSGTGTVSGLTLTGTVTGTGNLTLGGTLSAVTSAVAGTGISVSGSTGAVTFTNTDLGSSQAIFKNIAVAGQTTVTSTINNDTATFVAGSGITITTSGKNITFASTGTSGVSSLAAGNNIVLSGSTGAVTIQRVDGLQTVVTGNSGSTYNVLTTDQYVGTTRSATGTGTITLPLGSTVPVGRQYIIKDEGGFSGSSLRRITVAASGSDTIDGNATRGITSNHGALTVLWTGTRWSVI